MFGFGKRKAERERLKRVNDEARRDAEILGMIFCDQSHNPLPADTTAVPSPEMEKYFAVKNDILRYNMSKTGGVLDEGNRFDD